MATFEETFRRKEKKYRLDAGQLALLEGCVAGHMRPDAFFRSCVHSLYYDTPERDLIERSLARPAYKEKLRLRWYEPLAAAAGGFGGAGATPGDAASAMGAGAVPAMGAGVAPAAALALPVFVELKKKHGGIVYKRRISLDVPEALAFLDGMPYDEVLVRLSGKGGCVAAEAASLRARQIAREIEAFCARHAPLRPSALIACERTAYAGATDVGAPLRVTFDRSLRAADVMGALPPDALSPGALPQNAPAALAALSAPPMTTLLGPGEAIMEVKSEGGYPLWLVRALSACAAYPASFSKYGEMHRQARLGGWRRQAQIRA